VRREPHADVVRREPQPAAWLRILSWLCRKVDVWIPGKRNSNSHGARPVHLIITMIKWFRTSRGSGISPGSVSAVGVRDQS